MEYFLYGIVEADHVIKEIQALERIINEISDEIDNEHGLIDIENNKIKDLQFSVFNSKNTLEISRSRDRIGESERTI